MIIVEGKALLNPAVTGRAVIDAQGTFTPLFNELPVTDGHHIVDELNAMKRFVSFDAASFDCHPPEALYFTDDRSRTAEPVAGAVGYDRLWPAHGVVGTPGWGPLPGLPSPDQYDFLVYKGLAPDMHPYGACYHDLAETISTGLIEAFKANGILAVLVGGLALDYCVATTVRQLRRAGLAVVLVLDACRAVGPSAVPALLDELRALGVWIVQGVDELILSV